jgi:quinol-cytochrome oxidoreductase complex cytochrome b subunit
MSETQDIKETKTIPFYPDHLSTEIRVVWILVGLAVVIGIIAMFSPVGLEEPADPMVTPDHVKPEWYFLALYQLLKFIPKTAGVLFPILGILVLFVLPFFVKKEDSQQKIKARFIGSAVFVVTAIALTIWGWYS